MPFLLSKILLAVKLLSWVILFPAKLHHLLYNALRSISTEIKFVVSVIADCADIFGGLYSLPFSYKRSFFASIAHTNTPINTFLLLLSCFSNTPATVSIYVRTTSANITSHPYLYKSARCLGYHSLPNERLIFK